ncbi:hypothetical protein MUS_3750 [Bacillus velezensis YAU B9601-Y2]|uniref:Uncharacterized protein n=1 Tax=Bacillus amyloliquefaciens (strain Y2) TaxID=1155777 RepID=I2CAD9_BACAY|nr:hypothetical protein MUS_3750 [Bacillus velezensis YAU B9601-Y2]
MATNVKEGQNTASPFFTPASRRARWMAAVPELTAAALFTPAYSASRASNELTSGPSGAIQLERKASAMYSCSFPLI